MMAGLYIVIGVLILVVVFLVYATFRSRLKHYRLQAPIKYVEPKQPKRRSKPTKKKRKGVWVRIA